MIAAVHPWLAQLTALELPAGDYALFGSGPLLARGWVSETSDLDVIARGAAWDRALQLGEMIHLAAYDVEVVQIGKHITVGKRWGIGDFNIDDLIDTAELIGAIPCVRLEHVAAYKRIANRAKDRRHLEVMIRRRAI